MQDNLAAVFTPVDLWVLPTPSLSRWFTRVDWYLNWQMCKGLAYGGLHLPAETYRVADEFGVPVMAAKADAAPALLVSPVGRVPARRLLVLNGAENLKTWITEITRQARALHAKDVRVFLPTDAAVSEAHKFWQAHDCAAQFTPDLEINHD